MTIVKLQDIKSTHRNHLHSYTLIMRKQKEKLRCQGEGSLRGWILKQVLYYKASAPHGENEDRCSPMLGWVRKIPWRRKWQPTAVFLPGESQVMMSLVGCFYGVAQSRTRLKQLSSSGGGGGSSSRIFSYLLSKSWVAFLGA